MMKMYWIIWKLPNESHIVEMKKHEGLNGDFDIKKTVPAHSGAFILSNSKRITNNFIREKDGSYSNNIYYSDNDSI